jgi:uroporphyrinogen decarboxylase
MSQASQKTGRERVVAAYKGEFADCVPAYPIAGSFAGCLDGLSIEEYCTNPKKATKAMINYYERYQPDIMVAFNDLAKEVEAVGCHVKYSDYVVPSIDEHVLQDDKGLLARMEVPDPFRAGRIPGFLEQCEALSAQKFPSGLGAVLVGPWTIAMLMRNPELMCLDTLDDPAFVHDLMRFATEYAKRVGDAVLTTKIGLSYSDPTASCSLVGPDTYREFIKPYHQDLVNYFKAKKVGTTVHICGTTHQIHEDLVDVGFVAITIDLDQQSDPALQVDQLDRLVTLGNQRGVVGIGNVDVTIFERASRGEIEAEVRRCLDTVGKRSRFVLSTSCELPPRANPDCVKWFMEAAREYGRVDRILGA